MYNAHYIDFKIPKTDNNLKNLVGFFGLYRKAYNSGIEVLNAYKINTNSPNELEWILNSKLNSISVSYSIPKDISDTALIKLKNDLKELENINFLKKKSKNMEINITNMKKIITDCQLSIQDKAGSILDLVFDEIDIININLIWNSSKAHDIVLKNGIYFFRIWYTD